MSVLNSEIVIFEDCPAALFLLVIITIVDNHDPTHLFQQKLCGFVKMFSHFNLRGGAEMSADTTCA